MSDLSVFKNACLLVSSKVINGQDMLGTPFYGTVADVIWRKGKKYVVVLCTKHNADDAVDCYLHALSDSNLENPLTYGGYFYKDPVLDIAFYFTEIKDEKSFYKAFPDPVYSVTKTKIDSGLNSYDSGCSYSFLKPFEKGNNDLVKVVNSLDSDYWYDEHVWAKIGNNQATPVLEYTTHQIAKENKLVRVRMMALNSITGCSGSLVYEEYWGVSGMLIAGSNVSNDLDSKVEPGMTILALPTQIQRVELDAIDFFCEMH